jgi:hypothetical protein
MLNSCSGIDMYAAIAALESAIPVVCVRVFAMSMQGVGRAEEQGIHLKPPAAAISTVLALVLRQVVEQRLLPFGFDDEDEGGDPECAGRGSSASEKKPNFPNYFISYIHFQFGISYSIL